MNRTLMILLVLFIAIQAGAQVSLNHELLGKWTYVTKDGDSTIQQFGYRWWRCNVSIESPNGNLNISGKMQYKYRKKQRLEDKKAIISDGLKRYVATYSCASSTLAYGYRCDLLNVSIKRRFGKKTWNLDLIRMVNEPLTRK